MSETHDIASRIKTLEESSKIIHDSYTGSTDLVNRSIDSLVGIFGGETVQDKYEAQLEVIRRQARNELALLRAQIFVSTRESREQLQNLLMRTHGLVLQTLSNPGLVHMYKNTDFMIVGNRAIGAVEGEFVGAIEGGITALKGIFDFGVFLVQYIGSIANINPGYKDEIHKQCSILCEWISDTPGNEKWEILKSLVITELESIAQLPPQEQGKAIGKIAGNIISKIALMKLGIDAAGKIIKLKRHISTADKLDAMSLSSSPLRGSRIAVTHSLIEQAKTGKQLYMVLNAIVGGVAESILGASLAKLTASTLGLMRMHHISIAEKRKALYDLLRKVEDASIHESDPKKIAGYDRLHEHLVAEKEGLDFEEKQRAEGVRVIRKSAQKTPDAILKRREHGALNAENPRSGVQDLMAKLLKPEEIRLKQKPEKTQLRHLDTETSTFDMSPDKQAKGAPKETISYHLASYMSGLERVGELMSGISDWSLMSSSAMFLAKKGYKYLPDDLDINMDVKDFGKLKERLRALQKAGKITPPRIETLNNHAQIYGNKGMSASEMNVQAQFGNIRVVFECITETGKRIETEIFIGNKGRGFTQIGHVERQVETLEIGGRRVQYLSEGDLAEGYLMNLITEATENDLVHYAKKIEGHFAGHRERGTTPSLDDFNPPKSKDGTRTMNLLAYLDDPRIKSPDDIIPVLRETLLKYREHNHGMLTGELQKMGTLSQQYTVVEDRMLRIVRERFALDHPHAQVELPEFELFRAKIGDIQKMLAYNSFQLSHGMISQSKIGVLQGEIEALDNRILQDISRLGRDNASFPYFYELSNLRNAYIAPLLHSLQIFERASTGAPLTIY